MSNEFIDIHCHVLPGLDEGSSGVVETEKMLRIAASDGIRGIVATPHIIDGLYNNTKKTIQEAIAGLKGTNDSCQIYTGAEVRIGRNMLPRIMDGELPLLNDKRYFLLELPASGSLPVDGVENIVRSLTSNGITPIIAHPERTMAIVNDLSIMERLIKCGALFQVTAMSITGRFDSAIRRHSFTMIKKGYIHAVASDAHDTEYRPPVLSDAYEEVLKNFGEDEARKLFIYNPFKIISGEDIGEQYCPPALESSEPPLEKRDFLDKVRSVFHIPDIDIDISTSGLSIRKK